MVGLTFLTLFIYLAIFCIQGAIWGWAVNKIVENKGYRENWFWWGFFFGLLALIVALTKPDLPRTTSDTGYTGYKFGYGDRDNTLGENYVFKGFGHEKERKANYAIGEWRCSHCGAVNAGYVGTCGCGCDKNGNMPVKKPEQTQQINNDVQPQMLYCISCGKQMESEARFCKYCGAKMG